MGNLDAPWAHWVSHQPPQPRPGRSPSPTLHRSRAIERTRATGGGVQGVIQGADQPGPGCSPARVPVPPRAAGRSWPPALLWREDGAAQGGACPCSFDPLADHTIQPAPWLLQASERIQQFRKAFISAQSLAGLQANLAAIQAPPLSAADQRLCLPAIKPICSPSSRPRSAPAPPRPARRCSLAEGSEAERVGLAGAVGSGQAAQAGLLLEKAIESRIVL